MEERRKKIQKKKGKDILKKENKMREKELLVTSILNPLFLHIGSWKFESKNEKDDLVVKLNFVSKKICYEVMWNGFRKKIEIDWSNIMGIRASFGHKEPAILELELSQPPHLYEKLNNTNVDSHRRRHNKWVGAWDFTQGQVPTCRCHLIMFPPGMLDNHFMRLISFDTRLFELSQKTSYPTINMPYFYKQQQLNIVYHPNPFITTTSNDQTLRLPHRVHQPLTQFSQGHVRLPSSSRSFRSNFRTVDSMNNNFNWRLVPNEVASNHRNNNFTNRPMVSHNKSHRYWNNIGAMICRSNIHNNNPSNRSSNSYNFSNWTIDEYGLLKPPP